MAQPVGDFIIERLRAWGVRRIYGYPGDGINGVFGALGRAQAAEKKKETNPAPRSNSFKPVTKKWPPSWPPRMRSSRANWACTSSPRGPARRI
jgi:hypothetical protein